MVAFSKVAGGVATFASYSCFAVLLRGDNKEEGDSEIDVYEIVADMKTKLRDKQALSVVTGVHWLDTTKDIVRKQRAAGHVSLLAVDRSALLLIFGFLQYPRKSYAKMIDSARTTTALIAASRMGYLSVVEELLMAKDVHVNTARLSDGVAPLFVACQEGHLAIMERLLMQNEIEVTKATTDTGITPLFIACQQGYLEIVEKLLERSEIEVNKATTDDGATPLLMACDGGHLEIVEKLLERNEIEVNKATNDGQTALYKACQKGHLEIVLKLLEQAAIEVNQGYNGVQSPLSVAAYQGYLEIVKALLEQPNTDIGKYGQRAMDLASNQKHEAIVQLLSNYTTEK